MEACEIARCNGGEVSSKKRWDQVLQRNIPARDFARPAQSSRRVETAGA